MNLPDHIEELIYRSSTEEYTAEERRLLNEWLAESELNRKAYRARLLLWYQGSYSGKWQKIHEKTVWRKMEAKHHSRRQYSRIWRISAVAALVVLLIGGGLMYLDFSARRAGRLQESGPGIETGSPKAVLVLSSGEKINLGSTVADDIAEVGSVLAIDSAAVVYHENDMQKTEEVIYNELIVPVGGEYRLYLADGTEVYLNSESRLRYPVHFGADERSVELEGEAYFEVAPDKKRNFVVHTDKLSVKVLGTGFNVMAYRSDVYTEVTLLHGAVDVLSGNRNTVLKPDQQLVADNQTLQCRVREVNAAGFVAWKDGLLNFDAIPLEQLAVKLGRWYGVDFFFNGEGLKHLKFSGAFRKYNDINYILALIEKTTEVTFKINQKTIIVSKR